MGDRGGADRRARAALGASVLVGLAVFAFRFLSNPGFSNDHYLHLARAQQMLLGGLPVRDFVDPGMPLMYVVSALGLMLGGHNLLAEALIVFAAFGLTAGLSLWLTWQIGVPLAAGAAAVVLQALILPRSYSYPKLLLYALALLACWHLLRVPSVRRACLLGGVIAAAFLFRHDHGLLIGVAALVAVWFAGAARARWRLAAACVATTAALLTPWAVYVHSVAGLGNYFRSGVEFSRLEAAQTRAPWLTFRLDLERGIWRLPEGTPRPEPLQPAWRAGLSRSVSWIRGSPGAGAHLRENAEAFLFYLFLLLPLGVLATVAANPGAFAWTNQSRSLLVVVSVLALLVDLVFLRDPLAARLPDVALPHTVLGASVTGWALRRRTGAPGRRQRLSGAVAIGLFALAAMSVASVGRTAEQLDRMEGPTVSGMLQRGRGLAAALRAERDETLMPSRASRALMPVYSYLQQCTLRDDRLMYFGFAPELYFYASRGFAGGHAAFLGEYYSSDADQRQIRERLARERVPIVIIPADEAETLSRLFPIVSAHIDSHYQRIGDVRLDPDDSARVGAVYGAVQLAAAGRDQRLGWPCYR